MALCTKKNCCLFFETSFELRKEVLLGDPSFLRRALREVSQAHPTDSCKLGVSQMAMGQKENP